MALIKCPECGKEISDRAEACPYCAYPIVKLNENNTVAQKELHNTETKKHIDNSSETDNTKSLEEELRAREERRRKRQEAARIKKRKARRKKIIIISCIAVVLIAIAVFFIFDIPVSLKQLDSITTESANPEKYQELIDIIVSEGTPVYKTGINDYDEVSFYTLQHNPFESDKSLNGELVVFPNADGEFNTDSTLWYMGSFGMFEPYYYESKQMLAGTTNHVCLDITNDICEVIWSYKIASNGEYVEIASAMTEIVPSTYTYNSDLTIGDYSPCGNFYEISNLSSEAEAGKLIRNESRYEIDKMLKILWEIFDISPADLGFKNYEFVVDWSEVKE